MRSTYLWIQTFKTHTYVGFWGKKKRPSIQSLVKLAKGTHFFIWESNNGHTFIMMPQFERWLISSWLSFAPYICAHSSTRVITSYSFLPLSICNTSLQGNNKWNSGLMISNKIPTFGWSKGNCRKERKWLTQGCKSRLYSCPSWKGFYNLISVHVQL